MSGRSPQAKRAIRARAQRRRTALAPLARAVRCVTVLHDDGAAAVDSASAELLADHWRQVFAAPSLWPEGAVRRVLGALRPLSDEVALEPLTFDALAAVAMHARHSAPGPDGIPDAWVQCGKA